MPSYSAYIECPQCSADIRVKRRDRYWVRCLRCGHEHDPSEGVEPLEWRDAADGGDVAGWPRG